jgi:hypothetical protein
VYLESIHTNARDICWQFFILYIVNVDVSLLSASIPHAHSVSSLNLETDTALVSE